MNTLSINKRNVRTALKKKLHDDIVAPDLWGKGKKTDEELRKQEQELGEHIHSFPQLPSHYCRATSRFIILVFRLEIEKIFKLYSTHFQEQQKLSLSYAAYRLIFQSMNLKFYTPKKDRSKTCERHRNLNPSEQ